MTLPPSRTIEEWNHAEDTLSPEEFKDRLEGEDPTQAFIRYEDESRLQAGEWPAVDDEDLYGAAELLPEEQEYVIKFTDQLVEKKFEIGGMLYDTLQFVSSDEWSSQRQPDTMAAGALRLAEDYSPVEITQKEIAEVADKSAQTVQAAYSEAIEELGIGL